MAKKALITLRSKPKHPQRRRIKNKHAIHDGDNLSEALELLGTTDPSQVYVKKEYWGDEDYDVLLCCDRDQTDVELNKDIGRYNKKLKEYKKWYKENEATIIAEIERRRQIAIERKEKIDERERLRLEKELKRIRKLLQK